MFEPIVIPGQVLNEVKIFKPSIGKDNRGTIFSTYESEIHDHYLPTKLKFKHDKFAESKNNVLRGLHGDEKTWKLVTCVYGEIFEVVVDMRPTSRTYLKWEGFYLNSSNKEQILIPHKFVNGYYVLSDFAVFHYKLAYEGEYYDVKDQNVVKWNDERLNIPWPCSNPILNDRDK